MIKVGITGGIGSGKSSAATYLERRMNRPVYYTDKEAKRIVIEDDDVRKNIIDVFGKESYYMAEQPNGSKQLTYNRKHVGDIVFADKVKLAMLNSIVHPAVAADASSWNRAHELRGTQIVYHESAIILETHSIGNFHKLVVVTADQYMRVRRVCQRDGCTSDEAVARINAQLSDEERLFQSDYVIYNNSWGMSQLERDTYEMDCKVAKLLEVSNVPLRTLRPHGGLPAIV